MAAPRIHYCAQRRRAQLFETPDMVSGDHAWSGFSFEAGTSRGVPMGSHFWSKTTLIHVTRGQGSLRWKHRGVWNANSVEPGTISFVRRDVEIQSAVPSGSLSMMVLQLDSSRLQSLAPAQVLAIDKASASAQVTQDARLAGLLSDMCLEVRHGCTSGRLYGESISLALLGYIAGRYATPEPATIRENRLSPAQMRTLVSYIRDRMANDISVTELAALIQLRPSHFARIFKVSFGITPYQFVMRERIAGAKELFATTNLMTSQVAAELGFASQSHFAKVFRQFMGGTPKQYRAGM